MSPELHAANQIPGSPPPTHDPDPPNPDAGSEERRLLWIDDEIARMSTEVLWLRQQAFRVDCAETGASGLAMAMTSRYDGILLDLRLPDIPGLAVLARLHAEEIDAPVVVLTGWGDFEAARVAGRLGARGFESKPLSLEDLEAAVKRLVETSRPIDHGRLQGTEEASRDLLNPSFKSLAALLEAIHHLGRHSADEMSLPGYVEVMRRALARALIRALGDPALPMPVFLACAKALKRSTSAEPADVASGVLDDAEALILEALGRPAPFDPRVVTALEQVGSAAKNLERLTIEKIAKTIRIDPAHLGRLIKEETGFEFTAWRTANLIRPGLGPLLETAEDVKQIAGSLLGFTNLSQFDREFHGFFGLTPTEFRRGSSDAPSSESGPPRRNR